MAAARFIVRGKVQGVFFRASTREQALKLGLRGHAKNLPDGSVEVLAAGGAESIGELEAWLRVGPPKARVDAVSRTSASDDEAGEGFATL